MMRRRVLELEDDEEDEGFEQQLIENLMYNCMIILVFFFTDIDDFGSLPFDPNETTGKIGAKKMKKLEMKAEKRAQREVDMRLVLK